MSLGFKRLKEYFVPYEKSAGYLQYYRTLVNDLAQRFPNCVSRIPWDPRNAPSDPCIHLYNG